MPSALGVTHLIDTWSALDNKWHGTIPMEFITSVFSTSSVGSGATATVASIAIPDPGFEYYISGSGCVNVSSAGNQNQFQVTTQIRIGSTTMASTPGNDVVTNGLNQISNAAGSTVAPLDYRRAPGKQSGAKTVYLLVKNGTGNTITIAGTSLFNALTLKITPA